MDYNLGTLRRDVAYDLLDDEEFDPELIDRAINRAQREIFNQYELTFQEKIFSGTVPAGYTLFKYQPDIALAQDHVVTSPDGVQRSIRDLYMDFTEFNKMFPTPANNEPGPIGRWTSYGGNIILSAPTDQDYKLDIYYIKKPAKLLADTDVPEIPEEFSELLTLGAYIRIAKRNEDLDLAQMALQDYAGMLNRLVDRYGMRKTGPVQMKKTNRR
ncbi:hypothetical protein E6Q11_00785 [Candidatus Dojkabacteria bacterium]|uniref:Uncharacterized protein n=1 Tax=Candidatus Dojkabacteria bacterium TaxID=2099670 RepID=A0A5C7JAX5_9BACT|nr:MAG: hypothetical protein E6Q11_00785 [Candidatus Dojkabacteria bacterium]